MRIVQVFFAAVLALAALPAVAQRQEREAAATDLNAVGQGQRIGRQALKPGAFITPKHRQAVRRWLARHHGAGQPCLPGLVKQADACAAPPGLAGWTMGAPLPASVPLQALPAGLQAALPKAPPGNRYTLLGGDILLISSRSRVVVDAVPAPQ